MAHNVPPLVRAVLYDILQGGVDATGAVCWAVLHEEKVLGHGIVDERYIPCHKELHHPREGGGISFHLYKFIDILYHGLKIYGLKIHVTTPIGGI